jgi:hypothetical protein
VPQNGMRHISCLSFYGNGDPSASKYKENGSLLCFFLSILDTWVANSNPRLSATWITLSKIVSIYMLCFPIDNVVILQGLEERGFYDTFYAACHLLRIYKKL